jgi:hypothetical protein
VAHAQALCAVGAVRVVADVVLEQTRGAVVGEALAQLYDGDEEGGGGQVLADAAQASLLILAGLLAVGRGGRLGVLLVLQVVRVGAGLDVAAGEIQLLVTVGVLDDLLVQPARERDVLARG